MKFIPKLDRIEYGGCLIGTAEKKAINRVIQNQGGKRWTIGPESVEFEKELALKAGVKGAVVVNSGSSALLVAISALKLPKGSKVIIPALNFPTAYSSLLQNNLLPVVVDCDLETLNLSFDEVKKAIQQHPDIKAVVAVHIAGNVVDLETLRTIVGDRVIISDNCDGFGGTFRGKFIDSYADVSCISMHAAHIISMGEGGAVLSNNLDLITTARKMREWGRASGSDTITKHPGFPQDYRERYVFDEIGYNVKPLELQCAMGRVQLGRLEEFKAKRLTNYLSHLSIFSEYPQFQTMKEDPRALNCWFGFPFLCKTIPRMKVMDYFEENNIETRTIFSGNILKHPAYKNEPHIQIGDLENSNYVMHNGMFIGNHPSMEPEMFDFVQKVIEELVQ